jgi:NNP family nitrate/nitrite transporter-like MFS transporter
MELAEIPKSKQLNALGFSTFAFTICFAVWTIFSIIGIQLKEDLGLNDSQFGLLIGTPILTGSISRIFLGIWSDQYGGRIVFFFVMLSAAFATFLLTFADTFVLTLIAALGVGLAGGSFAVGVAYVSKWYSKDRQGSALGFFGVFERRRIGFDRHDSLAKLFGRLK